MNKTSNVPDYVWLKVIGKKINQVDREWLGRIFTWVIQEGFPEEVAFEMTLHYMKEPISWRSGGRAIQAEEIASAAAWGVKDHQASVTRAERPQGEVIGWVAETGKASGSPGACEPASG